MTKTMHPSKKLLTHRILVLVLSFGLMTSAIASNRVDQLKAQAEKGNVAAQSELGVDYYLGADDLEQDFAKAFYWHKKSANQGDVYSQFVIGAMYISGDGVRQDYTQAKKWLKKACDNADQDSCDLYQELNELDD